MTASGTTEEQPALVEIDLDLETLMGHLIRRSEKALNTAWGVITPGGLTIPQFSVLIELHRNPGLDQRTLGENIVVDASTVVDVCRRLIKRGYIAREKSGTDKRRNIHHLTNEGRRMLALTIPHVQTVDDMLLSSLTQAERARFMALYRKVASSW